ncbi:MAG: HAD hydrolase-like protein [Cellulosilyticaceae bacterium]
MIKNILFDFDGTLADTSEGIINCMHYALENLERKKVPDNDIKKIIGPPLPKMFEKILQSKDISIIDKGVFYFRERYSNYGLYELKLYDGVKETLDYLYNQNIELFIVTSKPYEFTINIIENLDVKKYFRDISGVKLQGVSKNKGDRIKELMDRHSLNPVETLMIGDRKEDFLAANQNSVDFIGMLYGYGNKKDLEECGCTHFCDKFRMLKKYYKHYEKEELQWI